MFGRAGVTPEQLAEVRKDVDEVERAQSDAETKLLREQVTTQRWLGDNLIKQSRAIQAIARAVDVQIDASVEPLLPQ